MEDGEKVFPRLEKNLWRTRRKQAVACKKSSSERRGHTGFEAVDDTAAAWYGNEVRVHTHLDTTRLPNAATAAVRGQRVASHR